MFPQTVRGLRGQVQDSRSGTCESVEGLCAHHCVDSINVLESHWLQRGVRLQSSPQRTWPYHLHRARGTWPTATSAASRCRICTSIAILLLLLHPSDAYCKKSLLIGQVIHSVATQCRDVQLHSSGRLIAAGAAGDVQPTEIEVCSQLCGTETEKVQRRCPTGSGGASGPNKRCRTVSRRGRPAWWSAWMCEIQTQRRFFMTCAAPSVPYLRTSCPYDPSPAQGHILQPPQKFSKVFARG